MEKTKHEGTAKSLLSARVKNVLDATASYYLDGNCSAGYTIMRAVKDGMMFKDGVRVFAPYVSAPWYDILRSARAGEIYVDPELVETHYV